MLDNIIALGASLVHQCELNNSCMMKRSHMGTYSSGAQAPDIRRSKGTCASKGRVEEYMDRFCIHTTVLRWPALSSARNQAVEGLTKILISIIFKGLILHRSSSRSVCQLSSIVGWPLSLFRRFMGRCSALSSWSSSPRELPSLITKPGSGLLRELELSGVWLDAASQNHHLSQCLQCVIRPGLCFADTYLDDSRCMSQRPGSVMICTVAHLQKALFS